MRSTEPLPLTEAVAYFEDSYLAARNSPSSTRDTYRKDLRELVAYLIERCHLTSVAQVERRHLESFLAELDRRSLSSNYRRRKVGAIRSLFRFLQEQGTIPASPADKLIPPRRERGQPRFLTELEYRRLLEAVRHETRDAAIIEVLLQTGLRLSEVARLKLTDVALPARISREPGNVGAVHVQGKGRKNRTVTLNWKACKAIRAYLAIRPRDTDDPHLFLTKFKLGIGPRSIELLASKYLAEAGIHAASVHTLRHTFGTQQAKMGTRLRTIQEALGHEDLKTTSIYVSLAREEMDRELQEHAL